MIVQNFNDAWSREAMQAMNEYVTTMTQRSQITVPAEVKRVLGLKPRDRVAFAIDGCEVGLKPVEFTLETAFGSVEPCNQPEDMEEVARIAKEEQAERAIEKMR